MIKVSTYIYMHYSSDSVGLLSYHTRSSDYCNNNAYGWLEAIYL
jgi:hypothetical protein